MAVLLLGLLAAAGCASNGEAREPDDSPYAFQRDRERCWLQTTRGLTFRCPEGPCQVALPDRIAFAQCMEARGWEMDDPRDVVSPRPPEDAPAEAEEAPRE